MTLVSAPPSIQSWIRTTDQSLRSLERSVFRLQSAARLIQEDNQYRPVAASVADRITAPEGLTGDWTLAGTELGPDVVVTTATGRIIVTMSAYMTATWDDIVNPAMAYGAMSVSVDTPFEFGSGSDAIQRSAARSFSYVPGQPGMEEDTVSVVVDLRMDPGTYTLRSEYLYQNFTPLTQIVWANRTLIAEPR